MKKEPFDRSRRVFVQSPPPNQKYMNIGGRYLGRRDEVKWEEWGIEEKRIRMLWPYLYHSDELELEYYGKFGDGLDRMSAEELRAIIDNINAKVEKHVADKAEYERKKCRFPHGGRENTKNLVIKIRDWRKRNGHEDKIFPEEVES